MSLGSNALLRSFPFALQSPAGRTGFVPRAELPARGVVANLKHSTSETTTTFDNPTFGRRSILAHFPKTASFPI